MKTYKKQDLTQEQKDFLYGTVLGDGSMCIPAKDCTNAIFTAGQGLKQKEYLMWKYMIMKEWTNSPPKIYHTKNSYGSGYTISFATGTHPVFTKIYKECYPNGKKIVSIECLNNLSDFSLAVWYMDDGCLANGITCKISTEGFTKEENQLIVDWFKSQGIETKVRKQKYSETKTFYYVVFLREGRNKFMKRIEKYIHPTMQYKLLKKRNCTQCGISFYENYHRTECSDVCKKKREDKYMDIYYQNNREKWRYKKSMT